MSHEHEWQIVRRNTPLHPPENSKRRYRLGSVLACGCGHRGFRYDHKAASVYTWSLNPADWITHPW